MNKKLEAFARTDIKTGLSKCTPQEQLMFKRMYAHGNLDMPIDDVVDKMEADRLSRAMEQVDATLAKKS